MRSSQPTRAIRTATACLALALLSLVAPAGAAADTSDTPDPPQLVQYGMTAHGYASIVWYPDAAADGVNIYRNGRYINTVRGGTVYNDFSPGFAPYYELVAFKGDRFSPKTDRFRTGKDWSDNFSARVELSSADQAATIRWRMWGSSLARYEIYRLNSGGEVRFGEGTRIVSRSYPPSPGEKIFVDTKPVRGASYGVRVIRTDGSSMPVITVKPDYSRPIIPLAARCSAFVDSCARPFEPAEFGITADDPVEIFAIDPSLPDPNSSLAPDPSADVIGAAIDEANESGFTNGNDRPQVEVPLNELTDPDNDGLSVFSDDDNDNDGVPTSQDRNDTDPSVGRRSNVGGGGGGGGGGGDDGGDWAPGYGPANPGGDEPGTPF